MRHYLISLAASLAAFMLLFFGVQYGIGPFLLAGNEHSLFHSMGVLAMVLLPPTIAGYIAGRTAKRYGIAFGALSMALSAAVLFEVLLSGDASDFQQIVSSVVIAALAGGCGELHSKRFVGTGKVDAA